MGTRIPMITLTVLIAISFGFGKGPEVRMITLEQKVEHASKNLMAGLHSNNTGLVESSVRMIAAMKLRFPSADIEELREELDKLSITNSSATVRYKAYIASNICMNPQWFSQEHHTVTVDDETFFIAASNRLQEKLLGLNSY